MAGRGRIVDADITLVKDSADIEKVVGEHVALRRQGTSIVGLCPFHDEASPSFNVNASKGMYYCFGCGEGGDSIKFIQQVHGLDFIGAIEFLADQMHIELRRETTPGSAPSGPRVDRSRLIAANAAASAYYQGQLLTPEAQIARTFLTERGFTREHSEQFDCGYAPRGWDNLTTHLTTEGFSNDEIENAGLASKTSRGGLVDRFRGRLLWPIKDTSGAVIGFGARRLHDDDDGPKYLNTPETTLYKKSKVLFGLDHARKPIGADRTAVVVEGYTDVMAFHAAGLPIAVATCGTAFGEDHAKILRRLLGDTGGRPGQVIYTFDGDAAGKKAATRAFDLDSHFQANAFTAVEAGGMDPCELRIASGDGSLHTLLTKKVPLFRFVLDGVIAEFDLTTPEGTSSAVPAIAPVLARIRDITLRNEYVKMASRWTGVPVDAITEAVRRSSAAQATPATPARTPAPAPATSATTPASTVRDALDDIPPDDDEPPPPDDDYDPGSRQAAPVDSVVSGTPFDEDAIEMPPRTHPVLTGERETLKGVIQHTHLRQMWASIVRPGDYRHPAYQRLASILFSEDDPTGTPVEGLHVELSVEPSAWAEPNGAGGEAAMQSDATRLARDSVRRQLALAFSSLDAPGLTDEQTSNVFGRIERLQAREKALATILV